MRTKTETPGGVGVLVKTFKLLELFCAEQPSWSQSGLVKATGFPKATISRLVRFLCSQGYLFHVQSTGNYTLGPSAVDLGMRAFAQFNIRDACLPTLEILAKKTQETVLLTSFNKLSYRVVCIEQIPSRRGGLRVFENIGATFPLHAGACAKAVLAFLPKENQEAVLAAPLEALTANTITDPQHLEKELAEIEKQQYAVSVEETYPGVYGVSSPFFGPGHNVLGSISIAAPMFRRDESSFNDICTHVLDAAHQISFMLGGQQSDEDLQILEA